LLKYYFAAFGDHTVVLSDAGMRRAKDGLVHWISVGVKGGLLHVVLFETGSLDSVPLMSAWGEVWGMVINLSCSVMCIISRLGLFRGHRVAGKTQSGLEKALITGGWVSGAPSTGDKGVKCISQKLLGRGAGGFPLGKGTE